MAKMHGRTREGQARAMAPLRGPLDQINEKDGDDHYEAKMRAFRKPER